MPGERSASVMNSEERRSRTLKCRPGANILRRFLVIIIAVSANEDGAARVSSQVSKYTQYGLYGTAYMGH